MMSDDSALRSSLDELKAMQPPTEGRQPTQAKATPGRSGGGSLLADLLSETSNEAQRELDEIKAELENRKVQEERARLQAEEIRRAQLDELRAQEARRRQDMIEAREARERGPIEPVVAPVVAPKVIRPTQAMAAQKGSNGGLFFMIGALVLAAVAVGAWWFTTQQTVPKTESPPVNLAVEPVAAPVAEAPAAERAETDPTAKPGAAEVAVVAPSVEEPVEAVPKPQAAKAPVVLAAPAKPRRVEGETRVAMFRKGIEFKLKRRGGRSRGSKGGRGHKGGKHIRIRGLNLGGAR